MDRDVIPNTHQSLAHPARSKFKTASHTSTPRLPVFVENASNHSTWSANPKLERGVHQVIVAKRSALLADLTLRFKFLFDDMTPSHELQEIGLYICRFSTYGANIVVQLYATGKPRTSISAAGSA